MNSPFRRSLFVAVRVSGLALFTVFLWKPSNPPGKPDQALPTRATRVQGRNRAIASSIIGPANPDRPQQRRPMQRRSQRRPGNRRSHQSAARQPVTEAADRRAVKEMRQRDDGLVHRENIRSHWRPAAPRRYSRRAPARASRRCAGKGKRRRGRLDFLRISACHHARSVHTAPLHNSLPTACRRLGPGG